jgi:cytochrome c oxidase subunit II
MMGEVLGMPGLTLAGLQDWWDAWNFRGPGAASSAANTDWVFYWIYVISTFFFVLLMVLMVLFTVKYRRRAGATPERSASHNTLLELSWSVIPTILLVWMFFEGFWGFADALVAPVEAAELVVKAQQWQWSLTYPNGAESPESTRSRHMAGTRTTALASWSGTEEGVQDSPIYVIPEEEPVRLRMYSIDVIHSFWVPDFRAKFDVMPNRYTAVWFQPTKIHGTATLPAEGGWKKWAGTPYEDHWVFCAEYCGSNHSEMYALLRVVPADVYRDIIRDWAEPRGAPYEIGAKLYKTKGCVSCHSLDGSRNVGPSWKDIYGTPVEFSDGTSLSAEQMTGVGFANYVRESVLTPSAKIVKTFPNQMPIQKLNDREIEAIIAFMKTISSHTSADELAAIKSAPQAQPGQTGATGQTGPGGEPKK